MHALIYTTLKILDLYWWVVVLAVIASWLVNYGVINRFNRFAMMVVDFLFRLTEPALRPIRRVIPSIGGIDISPLILLLIIYFLQVLIADDLAPLLLFPRY
ncbi:MAG TPA: YggT family protein [Stellaceae bacterium]|nr:YggT family protein [Stellaceae bacterium]